MVVSHNPGQELAANVAALRHQVRELLVIDNGSSNVAEVRQVAEQSGARLLANERNLGIATALNQALSYADKRRAVWLAMFDQDSFLPEGTLRSLLAIAAGHPDGEHIAVLATSHCDRRSGQAYGDSLDVLREQSDWRMVRTTITSGSLVRVATAVRIGGFDEELFIDSVDHDFCMRARRHGGLVIEGTRQILVHSLGSATAHRLFGRRVICTNHSALRRYYITRNQLEVSRRNLLIEPRWALRRLWRLGADSVLVLIFERDRISKLVAMITGTAHFALRRFGPKL